MMYKFLWQNKEPIDKLVIIYFVIQAYTLQPLIAVISE